MTTKLNNNKILNIFFWISSPLILIWILVYGFFMGFLGGVVWGVEKAQRSIVYDKTFRKSNVFLKTVLLILYIYVFVLICLLAGVIGFFIGPYRAYLQIKRFFSALNKDCQLKNKRYPGIKPLVMVVEDEKELAEFVSRRIKNTGKYETIEAYNGKEALRYYELNERFLGLAENRIKCIILDIKMPVMNGIEFLQELRKREGSLLFSESGSFHRMPVIVLTAYEDIEKLNETTHPRLGKAVKYILKPEKPEDYEELVATIHNIFLSKDQELINRTFFNANYRIQELSNKSNI